MLEVACKHKIRQVVSKKRETYGLHQPHTLTHTYNSFCIDRCANTRLIYHHNSLTDVGRYDTITPVFAQHNPGV